MPHGACAHLIPPCQPVLSLRRSRGRLVWLVVALTSGALLILLGSNSLRQRWIDPGPLTSAHATSAAQCSDCHAPERVSVALPSRLTAPERSRLADSRLCLKCHTLGDQPLTPHSVSPTRLISLEAEVAKLPNESPDRDALRRASHLVNPVRSDSGELACMTCHQEHHGRKFDLKKLSDAQCQSCHARQFASFEKGHPEFVNYSARTRTPIFFDHASHLREHFAARPAHAPTSCQDCHVADGAGRFMQVQSFAKTCAACHEAQIEGEGATTKGVAFFTLPGIDAETLAAQGIAIGEWPKFADGKITPFTELLLRRQPALSAALTQLHGVDLLDLSKATPAQLAAAEKFAWGVKELFFHLVVDGQSYLRAELKGEIAPAGLELPRAALLAAQRDWMPHLLDEVANYENGVKPARPKSATPTPAPTPAPNEKPASADQSLLGGDDDLTAATPTPSPAAADDDLTSGGGDLLAGGAAEATPSATPPPAPAAVAKSAEDWVAIGGWFRPQDTFTLRYRPASHADPFLVAWLDAAAKLASRPAPPAAMAIFRQMADPQSAGICMKCHTVDQHGAITQVNWQPTEARPKPRGFTTFSHAAHLSLFGNTACETCHQLNPKAQYAKFFSGESAALAERAPSHFESNFVPLSRAACVQCHQPKVAGDSCLLCHRYHAGATTGVIAGRNKFLPFPSVK